MNIQCRLYSHTEFCVGFSYINWIYGRCCGFAGKHGDLDCYSFHLDRRLHLGKTQAAQPYFSSQFFWHWNGYVSVALLALPFCFISLIGFDFRSAGWNHDGTAGGSFETGKSRCRHEPFLCFLLRGNDCFDDDYRLLAGFYPKSGSTASFRRDAFIYSHYHLCCIPNVPGAC